MQPINLMTNLCGFFISGDLLQQPTVTKLNKCAIVLLFLTFLNGWDLIGSRFCLIIIEFFIVGEELND